MQAKDIIITIREAAKCLDLPVNTLERWIRQGRIPAIKHSQHPAVFKLSILQKWAYEHHIPFQAPVTTCPESPEKPDLNTLESAMRCAGVFYGIRGYDSESVLQSAVNILPGLTDTAKILLHERLIERERLSSTGIGKGVAIPHPRSSLPDVISRCEIHTFFLEHPVDFNAIDDEPVFVMFLLLCPSMASHLHMLSRLAFCLRNDSFIRFLKTTPDSEALLHNIAEFEECLDRKHS